MQRDRHKREGYVLLDVLMALFIFGVGFAAFWGLGMTAVMQSSKIEHYHEAIRLAGNTIEILFSDSMALDWEDNRLLTGSVMGEGTESRFRWQTKRTMDPALNFVYAQVEVFWYDGDQERVYRLESGCCWGGN